MHFILSVLITLLILDNNLLAAEVTTKDLGPKYSMWDEFVSPLDPPASTVFYSGAAATLILLSVQNEVIKPAQRDLAHDKPLGKFSSFGDAMGRVIPNIVYAGTMLGDFLITKSQLSKERAILMTKTTLYSSAVTTAMKYTFKEVRPNGGGNKVSFPSGHTTTAFAFASVVGMEHDYLYGIAAYTLASFVGFSRMNDNLHWVHDVVAGATIGASYGIALCTQQRRKREWQNENQNTTQSMFQVLPTSNLDGAMGLYVVSY